MDITTDIADLLDVQYLLNDGKKKHRIVTDALIELQPSFNQIAWQSETIKAAVEAFADYWGYTKAEVWMTLRIAVSGGTVSPNMGPALELLGREPTLNRMNGLLTFITKTFPAT